MESKPKELLRVAKFGGTSLADGEMMKKAAMIVKGEDKRRFVVVSAPGKRHGDDVKITDMLYLAYESTGEKRKELLKAVEKRFRDISDTLSADIDIEGIFKKIKLTFGESSGRDHAASRGEYITALIFSKYLGYEFVDAEEVICFNENGNLDSEKTNDKLKSRLENCECAVIPGFYGSMPNDTVKTFSRGGSDITGALVARAVGADVYENFTDVDGFMMADPRIVPSPAIIEQVTYSELRELSYMGATVLHEDSVYPVRFCGIPINIRNTFDEGVHGTVIVSRGDDKIHEITGIAGRRNYSAVIIEKDPSDTSAADFYKKAVETFFEYGISPENIPGGIDSVGFVVDSEKLKPVKKALLLSLCRKLRPECVHIKDGIALIAVVGNGILEGSALGFKMIAALPEGGIKPELIIKPPGQSNIIIGIEEYYFEKAIKILYGAATGLSPA